MTEDKQLNQNDQKSNRDISTKKLLTVLALVLIGVVAFYLIGNTIKIPYQAKILETVKEPFTEQKCESVQVPYTDRECHTEQEPYSDTDCDEVSLVYKVEPISCTSRQKALLLGLGEVPAKADYKITNLDNQQGGTFVVWIGFSTTTGNVGEEQTIFVYPQSSKSLHFEANVDVKNCSHSVKNVPTKTVCQTMTKFRDKQVCEDVIKYRTETKCSDVVVYKDVQKEKEVTKYRSLLQEWGIVR